MSTQSFIEELARLVKKYAPQYGIKVYSPAIAQGILESDKGRSELATNANNFHGLKYRPGRCPTSNGIYEKVGSEQNKDGSYTSSPMKWCKFPDMESGIIGYFDFINTANYANLKGVTDPREYLENIKADGYATSIEYVDNLMRVIDSYDLTRFDKEEVDSMGYEFKTNIANRNNYGAMRDTAKIKYIVIHYTANDGDTDENNGKYFKNNIVKASAHYFVDDDSVTQSVPDNYVAWSVGGDKYASCSRTGGGKYHNICTNTNSLSIELCDDVKNGVIYPSAKTIENALVLCKQLMEKYNVPVTNVIRHFDVVGKICPAYWCGSAEKDAKWKTEFYNKLPGTTSGQATIETKKEEGIKVEVSTLQKGAKGSEVKALQALLIGYGYSCGNAGADGDFGSGTLKAVKAYQKANKLTVDGIVGKKTWIKLLGLS